jgi:hypothetical protein
VDFKLYLKTLSNYDLEYTIEVRPFKKTLVSLKALIKIWELLAPCLRGEEGKV